MNDPMTCSYYQVEPEIASDGGIYNLDKRVYYRHAELKDIDLVRHSAVLEYNLAKDNLGALQSINTASATLTQRE